MLMHCALLLSQYVVLRVLTMILSDTDINMDTDTDTYTDTVDNDTEAARKLYVNCESRITQCHHHALMMYAHFLLHQNEPCVMSN